MAMRRMFGLAALTAVAMALAAPAWAQAYPSKTIHIVVTAPPGGITDTLARALAQKLTSRTSRRARATSAWTMSPSPRPTATLWW